MKFFEQSWRLPGSFLLILLVHWASLATPAGVLPYSFYQGKPVILVGVDHHRPGFWIDFGGKEEPHETTVETAAREFSEETMYSFFNHTAIVKKRLQFTHPIIASCGYHMYPLEVPFIEDLNKKYQELRAAHHKPGCPGSGLNWLISHHVEKIDYAWVYADDLKKAFIANPNHICLRSIDGRRIELHHLLAGTLGTQAGKNFLFGL